jgi:hypothetical protein
MSEQPRRDLERRGLELDNTYAYRGLYDLATRFVVVRYLEPPVEFERKRGKVFHAYRCENGSYIADEKTALHIYGIEDLAGAPPERIALGVEGEKKRDRLAELGYLAVSFHRNTWRKEYGAHFAGRAVVLLSDGDMGGLKKMEALAKEIAPFAAIVRHLPLSAYDARYRAHLRNPELPDAPPDDAEPEEWIAYSAALRDFVSMKGRDVYDYFADGDIEEKKRTLYYAVHWILDQHPRPTITVTARQDLVIDECHAALHRADKGLYVRGGAVVRVRHDAEPRPWRSRNAPAIEVVSEAHVRDRLSRVANFITEKQERPIPPPAWAGRFLLDRDTLRFPPLEGITECPTMRPDGSILQTPGYDAASGVIYEPGDLRFPQIPETPTSADLVVSKALLADLFADFPFVADSDRAAAHAALFSVVARSAYLGCTPLFVVRAPTPGTGKSLLCDVISLVATGREAARMGRPGSDEEMRKSILAIALDGSSIILLDNETGDLGSRELARAITSEAVTDRLLGVSKKVTMPLRAVWFATGNNLTFSSDLARRVVPIDLDAAVENPEDRKGFRHPDLRAYAKEARPRLVAAVLTILRAYHVAERPSHGKSRMGSFEQWDALIRGACIWAELGDPEGGRERVRADDADTDALGGALDALCGAFGESSFTAAEATRWYANADETFKAAIAEWVSGRGVVDARSIGNALRRTKGRIIGGRVFVKAGADTHEGTNRWRIKVSEIPTFI